MRVSPRPLPSFAVDVIAASAGGAIAWTGAAAALRGASASKATALVAAAASALVVAVAVRIGTRSNLHGHRLATFVLAALAPIGLVALAAGRTGAIALASIPALITALACTVLVATARSARAHGNLDAPERVATTAGLATSAFSAMLLPFLGWMAVPPVVIGTALLAAVVAREGIRARWLKRVHSGREPGWAIVHEADLDTREAVPGATDHPLADAVLAYVSPSPDPYRVGRPHVVARVHAKPDVLVRTPRARAGKALAFMGVAATLAMVGAVAAARIDDRAHRLPLSAADLGAPACAMARPYFRDRLQQVPGVAWGVLLTRAQDPSIAAGDGVVLVVPREGALGPRDEEQILGVLDSIPCIGKLALRIDRPTIRPFAVTAKLRLEPNADAATVRAEAEREMRELVDVTASTTLFDHTGIGADDRTFGWRARYVLRHVPGVAKASVLIDGRSDDVPLEPRELPSLGKLELALENAGDPP